MPEYDAAPSYRFWGSQKPPKNRAEIWGVEVENRADSKATAVMRMYGPIDREGGVWGIAAKDVVKALDGLPANVGEIRVRLNSPGGDAWEGMTILNNLRAHPARVVAVVDGLAGSAASFIAAGADETVMSPGSQLMVHDASAVVLAAANAARFRKIAETLDSTSNSIASVYAEATGGTVEEWREVMRNEAWYTADEAVAAGLANRVAVIKDEEAPDPAAVTNRFDLSIFNYAGRAEAPAPHMPPNASAVGSTHTEGGPAVAFSDEQITTLRAKLELPDTADEAAILAAVEAVVDESLDERPAASASSPTPQPAPQPDAAAQSAPATPGTMVIDSSAWEEQQARIRRLEAQEAKRKRDERDEVIAQAVRDGKFLASRADDYKRIWDADPEAARQLIDRLQRGVVPVNEMGHAGDDADYDEFAHLFPQEA